MCVIPGGSVTFLFTFCYAGVYAMGGGLKGIYQDKRKDDTIMDSCKGPPSLQESWNPYSVRIVAIDNAVS